MRAYTPRRRGRRREINQVVLHRVLNVARDFELSGHGRLKRCFELGVVRGNLDLSAEVDDEEFVDEDLGDVEKEPGHGYPDETVDFVGAVDEHAGDDVFPLELAAVAVGEDPGGEFGIPGGDVVEGGVGFCDHGGVDEAFVFVLGAEVADAVHEAEEFHFEGFFGEAFFFEMLEEVVGEGFGG